jgi:hypothetical protein
VYDIRRLVYEAPDVYGQATAVDVVGLFAELIEKLGAAHGHQEVERIIRVRDDDKERGLFVTEGVEFKLIVHGDLC